jgi:hypothetical protein
MLWALIQFTFSLATSKVAADNKIGGPIARLAKHLNAAAFGHAMVVPQSVGQARPVIGRAWTSQALIAYLVSNLVAAMPKLSLNSLPRSKFREALCHVVRAFGIHPQFV